MLIDVRAKLVMWEKVDMPESNYDESTKKWVKTGKTTEKTNYIIRDVDGTKLIFMSDEKARQYEGKDVDVQFELSYDEFNRKNKISFKNITLSK